MKPHVKIVSIYVLLGLLWIYFSDTALTFFYDTPESVTYGQHLKGYFFILFTGTLIYFLIKRDFDAVKKAKHDLKQSYEQTIYGWVNVMDIRHQETKSHTERVTKMTLKLAQKVGITDPRELECIQRGAILHDIGKIGIPDGILIKLGDLTAEEWAIIQEHPNIAHEILSKIEYLRPCIDIPYSHHEKWDGSGYPLGLQGQAIPKVARIFAIIDVWDAVSHPRVYKNAWPEAEVIEHLKSLAGNHLDPDILEMFFNNYKEIKAAANKELANEES